jgi:biotin carboxyl carrier protein
VKLAVDVSGRTHTVEVRRGPDGEVVTLNGQPLDVHVAAAGAFWSMLIGRRAFEVSFVDAPGGVTTVHVNGQEVSAVVTGAGHFGAAARRARPVSDGAEGPQPLRAPMPGRVVKVLAHVGDEVTTRQGLVVIEAMKMENELRSPKTGRVTDIKVAEGASVDAGAVLVVVE